MDIIIDDHLSIYAMQYQLTTKKLFVNPTYITCYIWCSRFCQNLGKNFFCCEWCPINIIYCIPINIRMLKELMASQR